LPSSQPQQTFNRAECSSETSYGTKPGQSFHVFCERCRAESTDERAGDVRRDYTWGGYAYWGRAFFGQSRPCPECHSYVTTLWQWYLGFPLTPVGSYRCIWLTDGRHFYSRRTKLNVTQVRDARLLCAITVLVCLAGLWGLFYWDHHR
jgi:hypothetical protein